jgi:hypothetical protein
MLLCCGCSDVDGRREEALGVLRSALVVDERSLEIVQDIADARPSSVQGCEAQVTWAFAALYSNVDVAEANARLIALDTEVNVPATTAIEGIPCYWAMSLLTRTYLHPVTSARLTATARHALQQMMWRYVSARSLKSDATSGGTWHIHMSENHDAMQKSVYLLATNALRSVLPAGDGTLLADGASLLEHQNAWRSYWKLYFRERAREGIGVEVASPAYSKYALQSYYNVRDFAGSSGVRDQAEKFLTLYWADVANDFQPATGVRGGAQTRTYKHNYALTGAGQMGLRAWTYIYDWHGGRDWSDATHWTALVPATSGYRIPSIVTDMAVNTTKPSFSYVSRRPGRQSVNYSGDGDSLRYAIGFDASGSSNLRRYTYNTPDYVMGVLKVDASPTTGSPSTRYSLLNRQNRWSGVVFADGPDARIAVFGRGTGGGAVDPEARNGYGEILGDAGPNAMVIARDPSVTSSDRTRVFVAQSVWDNGQWYSGEWLFLRSGNGFCALRASSCYTVLDTPNGKLLELADEWAPIVIQLGQASQYAGSFDVFRSSVVANQYSYDLTTNELTYVSENGDVYRIRRNSSVLPSVNGGGSLDPAKTYSSPYILGYHGENTVTLTYDGRPPLVLDFTF